MRKAHLHKMATKQNSRFPFQITRTRIILCASIVIAVLLADYCLFRPLSPEAIRDRTLQALQKKDAEALCRLADPEELAKTHLTPQKVTVLLQDSLWKHNKPQVQSYSLFADKPADKRSWVIKWRSDTPPQGTFGITVVDDPHIGWKLVLSDVLTSAALWCNGRQGGQKYAERIHELDIVSGRQQDGSYRSYTPKNTQESQTGEQ